MDLETITEEEEDMYNTAKRRSKFSEKSQKKSLMKRLQHSSQYYSNLLVKPPGFETLRHKTPGSFRVHGKIFLAEQSLTYEAPSTDTGDGRPPEIYPKSPYFSVPYFIITISIVELTIFLFHVIHMKYKHCIEIDEGGPVPLCSAMIYNPHRRYEVWRLFSYMFVHAGYIHIASNILVQLLLGLPLEIVHGPLRVSAIYLTGVLSGSLITSVSDPSAYLAGASGGVYALMIAHLPTLIMNWRDMKTFFEWIVSILILLIAVVDLSIAIVNRYMINDQNGTIGYAAHLGGAAAGFLVGMNVLRNFHKKPWEGYLRLVCFLLWSLGLVAVILVNSFARDMYPRADHSKVYDCAYRNACVDQ